MPRWHRFRDSSILVWFFAVGYFFSYVPYSALAKAITRGYLTPGQRPVSGFDILPPVLLGTIITMPLLVAALGGFRFTSTQRILGRHVPFPRTDTIISGIGFAVIIATTTLAFSFAGVSIVLALVLMRAGVLTLAPIVDAIAGRRVHPYSATALVLSFASVAVALSQVGSYELALGAIVNLCLYWCGYFARLNLMSRYAKVADEAINRRFIAEECIVAMIALVAIFAAITFAQDCSGALSLRCGLATWLASPLLLPAILIGTAYGFLGVFATLIYLNRLENSFAIPVFCCASLLSGLAASLILSWLYGAPSLSGADAISAASIMIAGSVLYGRAAPEPARAASAGAPTGARRLLLFICSGNTSRSPIAHAICNAEIVRRLARSPDGAQIQAIEVASAGLTAKAGAPMTAEAQHALRRLGVPVPPHASRNLTAELVDEATAIICMTSAQCKAVLAINPKAAGKVHRLHPFRDLADPSGQGARAFLKLSRHMQHLIVHRLAYFMILGPDSRALRQTG
jgi:protein-tyrosine-phosphatase